MMSLFSPASERRNLLERMLQTPAAYAVVPRRTVEEGT